MFAALWGGQAYQLGGAVRSGRQGEWACGGRHLCSEGACAVCFAVPCGLLLLQVPLRELTFAAAGKYCRDFVGVRVRTEEPCGQAQQSQLCTVGVQ